MKNKRTGKGFVISVLIVVAFVASASITGTRRVSANTLTVTNTNDSGAGSLRQAIADAMPGDTIDFNLAGCPCTITLTSGELVIGKSLTIQGPGASQLTVSGGGVSRVFFTGRLDITPSGFTVTLDGLTVTGGNGVGAFGSIITGGGIFNNIGTTLTVSNSTISGNTADLGGGLFNNAGTLTLNNSTVSGNTAINYGGISNNNGTMTVTNSTISGNSAISTGGGLGNNFSTMTVTNSTISGNSAGFQGGGIANNSSSIVTFKNTIIANGPSGGNCGGLGATTPVGVNFSTDNSCAGFTQVTAAQLNLGSLQDNGGPTFTHALLPGSVAIDAVTDCTDLSAMPVTTDQRGKPRPADGDGNGSALCDAGAFELQPCSITCPANITQSNDPNQCGAVVNYPDPSASGDGCGKVFCAPASGSTFPLGTTTVTCMAQAGPSCTFTVTVSDTQPPTITCAPNVVVSNTPGQCSAIVNYGAVTASDNCTAPSISCMPASGTTFPVGTTTVTCTAIDAATNTASCSFTVTVNDTQTPAITCPANITVPTDPNQCSAVVNYPAPMVSDNCPGVGAPVCLPAAGATFPKGTTTVTCMVTDALGNTAGCSFTVTVNDTQPPTITCPANVTAVAAQTCPISSTATVNFPAPTVSDNCPGVTSACNPPSGSVFPVGTTTVTCTATDTSGNTATCSFTVTVFSGCLQDDSNPANVVLFNAASGEYRFCCGGTIFSGVGAVLVKGCVVTVQHYPSDRRVLIKFDGAVGAGTASLQSPPGTIRCTITDRNTRNNTCACQ